MALAVVTNRRFLLRPPMRMHERPLLRWPIRGIERKKYYYVCTRYYFVCTNLRNINSYQRNNIFFLIMSFMGHRTVIFCRDSFFYSNAVLGSQRTDLDQTLPNVRKSARFESGRPKLSKTYGQKSVILPVFLR